MHGLAIDGQGKSSIETGVPFFDHMLDQLGRHGGFDLTVRATGDTQIDAHHTVEDIGITLGQALAQAWGDKRGLRRYGHAYVPLDEALSRVVVDFSGRPGLHMDVQFSSGMIGALGPIIRGDHKKRSRNAQIDMEYDVMLLPDSSDVKARSNFGVNAICRGPAPGVPPGMSVASRIVPSGVSNGN